MQTRKEVEDMHAALIQSRAMNMLIALLASLALATALAPVLTGNGAGARSEPNMPANGCPPHC